MKTPFTFLAAPLLLLLTSCGKDPVVPPDPCKGKTPLSLDFTITEPLFDSSFETTKALAPGTVQFKAKGSYDSVRWYVGGPQNTSSRNSFGLYFPDPEDNVSVSLIGYKKPNAQCFPNGKTADTVVKNFSVVPWDSAAIIGRFHGYNVGYPLDTFTVTITHVPGYGFFVKNIPKDCPGWIDGNSNYPKNVGLNIKGGYASFQMNEGSTTCMSVKGYGRLNNTLDSLQINYTANPILTTNPYTSSNVRSTFNFIGVRKP